jgi:hypothetical protein
MNVAHRSFLNRIFGWSALLISAAVPMSSRAANINYGVVAGAQDFTIAGNWVGGVAPTPADIPIISSVDGIVDYPYIDTAVTVQRFLLAELTGNSGGLEVRSTGALTTTSTSAHYVGARGTGNLRLLNGSTLNINGSLQVGWGDSTGRGNGTVTQSGGTYNGTSTSTSITIGNSAIGGSFTSPSVGVYNLNAGTMTLGGALIVGNAGTGTFNMNSGTATLNSFLQIGRTGTGTVMQSGGDLSVFRVSADQGIVIAPFAGATGLYEISGGSLTVAGTNSGLWNGVVADTNNSSGTFRIVGSAPTITIGSNFRQFNGSTLDLRIGTGISPMDVAQTATLAGTLNVQFTTTPTVGQEFTIIKYGTLAGTFSTFDDLVDSPAGANSVKLSIDYGGGGGTAVVLKVDSIQSLHPGDFDGDGDVDGADFVAWQTNFPKPNGATLAEGDADGDGDVDGADFVVWQTNFPFTPGPGTTPVPEPAAVMLLAVGGAALLARRRSLGKLME